jgi:hypothetical protein
MAVTKINLWNDALNELAAAPVNSVDEASLEAKQCRACYDRVVAEMLEAHDWSFQLARQPLAPLTLDRPGEWLYAYAAPSDIAKALGIVRQLVVDPLVLIYPGADQRPAIPYLLDKNTIYTNISPASFAYVSSNVNLAGMSQRCGRAISLEMAVRMAIPLKKNRELKGDLIKQAQVAMERAIADDMNRSPVQTPDYVTDVEIARNGYGDSLEPPLGV